MNDNKADLQYIYIHKSFILQKRKNQIKDDIIRYYNINELKKNKKEMKELYKLRIYRLWKEYNEVLNKVFIKNDGSFTKYKTTAYIDILGFILDELNKNRDVENNLSVIDDNSNDELIYNFDMETLFIHQYDKEDEMNEITYLYPDDYRDCFFK